MILIIYFCTNKFILMFPLKIYLRILSFFLVATAGLSSCNKETNISNIYVTPTPESLDSTLQWLAVVGNFINQDYMSRFYTYYNAKIKAKDYNNAYLALEKVQNHKINNVGIDSVFLKVLQLSDKVYVQKVTVPKFDLLNDYLANYYIQANNFKKAIYYLNKTVAKEPKSNKAAKIAAYAYCNLSFCYNNIGQSDKALAYNYQCLTLYTNLKNTAGIASAYSNFGNIYLNLKHFKKTEMYYNKSISLYKNAGDVINTYLILNNKLSLLQELKTSRFDNLADSTYYAWKEEREKNAAVNVYITNKYIIGLVNKRYFRLAKIKLDEIKVIFQGEYSEDLLQDYTNALAYYEINANKKISDITIYKKVIPIMIQNEDFYGLTNIYRLLKDDALSKNDFKTAFYYNVEEHKTREYKANDKMKNIVIDAETKYNTKQKEQQLTLKELQIQKNHKNISYLIAMLIIVVLGVVINLLVQNKKKLKKEKQLKTMFTKQLLENTEEERKRIANDLHDGISHELLGLKSETKEGFIDLNLKIDGIINEVRQISRNLHPAMFDRVGLVFSIKQLAEYLEVKNQFMITTDLMYKKTLSPENELQLYRIVQESLNNIIKYAEAHAAKISLKEVENYLILEILDNGKGFDVAEKLNGKTSFGLHSIIERSTIVGGKAQIKSDDSGTTINVKIPLKS